MPGATGRPPSRCGTRRAARVPTTRGRSAGGQGSRSDSERPHQLAGAAAAHPVGFAGGAGPGDRRQRLAGPLLEVIQHRRLLGGDVVRPQGVDLAVASPRHGSTRRERRSRTQVTAFMCAADRRSVMEPFPLNVGALPSPPRPSPAARRPCGSSTRCNRGSAIGA